MPLQTARRALSIEAYFDYFSLASLMDRLPPPLSSLPFAAPALIGRRDFMKRCGVAGATLLGAGVLGGCESWPETGRIEPASDGFFTDGTDFAD